MPGFSWYPGPELPAGPWVVSPLPITRVNWLGMSPSATGAGAGSLPSVGAGAGGGGVALCSWRVTGLTALVCARVSQGGSAPGSGGSPPAPILLGSRGGGGRGGHSGLEDTVGLDGGDDDLLQLLQSISQISAFQHILSGEDTALVTCQSLQLCRMTTRMGQTAPAKSWRDPGFHHTEKAGKRCCRSVHTHIHTHLYIHIPLPHFKVECHGDLEKVANPGVSGSH